MATVRGSSKVVPSTSVGQIDLPVPAASQDGDVAVLIHLYNPSTQDSILTGAGGTGWTLIGTQPFSSSFRVRYYKKDLATTDAGDTVSFTNTTSQRMAAAIVALAGCTDVDVFAFLNETISQSTHPGATTAALSASGVGLVFYCERSSAPSGSVTAPAGFTLEALATGFATGNGSCSIGTAVKLTSTASGSTVGGGSWGSRDASGANPVNQSGVITIAVAVTEAAPITQVGRTLSTTWKVRETVGNGFTHDLSDLFNVAGQAATWQITDVSVAGRTLSTTWKVRKLVSAGLSTTWNIEQSPEEPPPDTGDPDAITKRVRFPTYKVPVGKGTLFSRFLIEQPQSIVKVNGEWIAITSPAQELLATAEAYFIGGYSFLMSDNDVLAYGLPPEFVEDIS